MASGLEYKGGAEGPWGNLGLCEPGYKRTTSEGFRGTQEGRVI